MHRKAAALGRDHLKLPREDESAAKIVAVTGVLERWNQKAKDAAGKVKRTSRTESSVFRSRPIALLIRVREMSAWLSMSCGFELSSTSTSDRRMPFFTWVCDGDSCSGSSVVKSGYSWCSRTVQRMALWRRLAWWISSTYGIHSYTTALSLEELYNFRHDVCDRSYLPSRFWRTNRHRSRVK